MDACHPSIHPSIHMCFVCTCMRFLHAFIRVGFFSCAWLSLCHHKGASTSSWFTPRDRHSSDQRVERSVGRGTERRDGVARTKTDGCRRTWRKRERSGTGGERRRRRVLRTHACHVPVEGSQAAPHQALQTEETSHRSRRIRSDASPKRHVRERGSAAFDVSCEEILRRDGFSSQVHRSEEQASVRFVGRVSRRTHHGARRRPEAACLAQRPRLLALTGNEGSARRPHDVLLRARGVFGPGAVRRDAVRHRHGSFERTLRVRTRFDPGLISPANPAAFPLKFVRIERKPEKGRSLVLNRKGPFHASLSKGRWRFVSLWCRRDCRSDEDDVDEVRMEARCSSA